MWGQLLWFYCRVYGPAADGNGDVTSVFTFILLVLLPDSLTSCNFGETLVSDDESFVVLK